MIKQNLQILINQAPSQNKLAELISSIHKIQNYKIKDDDFDVFEQKLLILTQSKKISNFSFRIFFKTLRQPKPTILSQTLRSRIESGLLDNKENSKYLLEDQNLSQKAFLYYSSLNLLDPSKVFANQSINPKFKEALLQIPSIAAQESKITSRISQLEMLRSMAFSQHSFSIQIWKILYEKLLNTLEEQINTFDYKTKIIVFLEIQRILEYCKCKYKEEIQALDEVCQRTKKFISSQNIDFKKWLDNENPRIALQEDAIYEDLFKKMLNKFDLDFRQNCAIRNVYSVDFFLPNQNLIFELNGISHFAHLTSLCKQEIRQLSGNLQENQSEKKTTEDQDNNSPLL